MRDPVLERALRQVRAEKARDRRRRARVVTAVGVALAGLLLAGGVHLGRRSVPADRVLVATTASGVRITATLSPADGWVRLHATVDGVAPGEKCELVVIDADGRGHVAGGWIVGSGVAGGVAGSGITSGGITGSGITGSGVSNGVGGGIPDDDTAVTGSVLVPLDDVLAVSVVTVDGRVLVSATT